MWRFGRKFSTTVVRNDKFRIGNILVGSALGGLVLYSYFSDSRAGVYSSIVMPLMHKLDPEDSHKLSIWLAKHGIAPRENSPIDDPNLNVSLWGYEIDNPIGLAAGYDKNAEAIDSLFGFGFGLVEIGSVTPRAQKGNTKPRFFRLPADAAVINRYGFNSEGHVPVQARLQTRVRRWLQGRGLDTVHDDVEGPRSLYPKKLLGVNLGKNKYSEPEDHSDYVTGVNRLGDFADYIVVNISSPNTPGLRALQRREPIEQLLTQVKNARDDNVKYHPPILVKIAPDCTDTELEDIASVVQKVGIDGIIISNTTVSRPSYLLSDKSVVQQTGGLSGAPVKPLALNAVRKFYKLTDGKVPIIGCGGISSAQDAIEFAKAGASLVQLYTSLGYQGPGLVVRIKDDLSKLLKAENKKWTDLIGSEHQK